MTHMWRQEDNFVVVTSPSTSVCCILELELQFPGLHRKLLYLLSHITGSQLHLLVKQMTCFPLE